MNIEYFYDFYEELFIPKGIEKLITKFPLGKYILAVVKFKSALRDYPFTNNESSLILKKIIIDTKHKLKQDIPNAKMIIIIYDEKLPNSHSIEEIKFVSDKMNDKIWSELEKEEDITVVHTKDLTGFLFDKDYKLEYDIAGWHPNGKAWEVFTPLFAEKYIK